MEKRNPWAWIPSLYFAEGLPYVVVMTLSVIMYKRLGVSNTDIALFTSWLYFPWVIKPIWSPFVDLIKTKRWWIYSMQLLIGGGMAGVAFVLPGDFFLRFTLAFFWLMAFSSATHDIAADGFYMLGLTEEQQAFFIGIRNTFYRVAMLTGQGLLVMLAGLLEESTGRISFAWSLVFFVLAGTFIALALWHKYILPRPASDAQRTNITPHTILVEFGNTFVSFFSKKGIIPALLFMLTYRLGESQLVKLASPFLLDGREVGGLALSTGEVGFAYGTVGVISLLLGGVLGGLAISRGGLKTWLWPMALAISLPNLVYLYMAYTMPCPEMPSPTFVERKFDPDFLILFGTIGFLQVIKKTSQERASFKVTALSLDDGFTWLQASIALSRMLARITQKSFSNMGSFWSGYS